MPYSLLSLLYNGLVMRKSAFLSRRNQASLSFSE